LSINFDVGTATQVISSSVTEQIVGLFLVAKKIYTVCCALCAMHGQRIIQSYLSFFHLLMLCKCAPLYCIVEKYTFKQDFIYTVCIPTNFRVRYTNSKVKNSSMQIAEVKYSTVYFTINANELQNFQEFITSVLCTYLSLFFPSCELKTV
jgi:hypothetical protein